MGIKNRGGSFHPSRVSGRQKQARKRDYDALQEKTRKKKIPLEPLDLSKPDWSKTRPK